MASGDTQGEIDFNPVMLIEKLDTWLDSGVRLIPNLVTALIVFVLFYVIGVLVKRSVTKAAQKRNRDNLGDVLGGFLKSLFVVLGILLAATIVAPSLKPGDLIAGLGVSSVAIGFAFKDILQNWLAGLLILLRQPFQVGDQIVATGYEGTVQRIETRATLIRTYDGMLAVIPNSEIYTSAVLVKTAFETRRSQYDVGIGYGDDIDTACEVMLKAINALQVVQDEPAPEAIPWEMAASWITIRVRWWTKSERKDEVHCRGKVIRAMKLALDEAGIDMPFETQVQLFHDQTEDRDGFPGVQREGWPAPKDGTKVESLRSKRVDR